MSNLCVHFDFKHLFEVNNAFPDILNESQPLYTIILKLVALLLVRCWIQLFFVRIQAKNLKVHESDKYNELVYQKRKRNDLFSK